MNPPRQHRALIPVMNQKVERQVWLDGGPLVSEALERNEWGREKAYAVNSVKIPPMVSPIAAPTGAPAEKVAKAMERVCEGGKVCARIPSCDERRVNTCERARVRDEHIWTYRCWD